MRSQSPSNSNRSDDASTTAAPSATSRPSSSKNSAFAPTSMPRVGLVEQQDARLMLEHAPEHDLLLVAAR